VFKLFLLMGRRLKQVSNQLIRFKPVLACLLVGLTLCDSAYAAGQYKLPNGEVLNDPTRPHYWNKASGPKAKQQHYTLSYILKTSQRTNAIINGQKVTEGDVVSGAKVISINQNTVTMLVDGKRKTLHLTKGGSIRK
jgi:hypothetical protein